MNTYAKEHLKQFLVASSLFVSMLTISSLTFAYGGDRGGNGGSGDESSIAARQAVLEGTALKIKKFFSVNGARLQREFPEFKVHDLVTAIERSKISVLDVKELKDKHRKNRSCLNYSNSNLIECKYSDVLKLEENPEALFVLIMHEYLGLLGVEETSPQDSSFINGYSISKRLAGYVNKVNDYDLVLVKKTSSLASNNFILVTEMGMYQTSAYLQDHKNGTCTTISFGEFSFEKDTHFCKITPTEILFGKTISRYISRNAGMVKQGGCSNESFTLKLGYDPETESTSTLKEISRRDYDAIDQEAEKADLVEYMRCEQN